MPWSKTNTISSMKNKSDALKQVFADAANSALAKGRSEEDAVFAGLAAVKIAEKKQEHARKALEPLKTLDATSVPTKVNKAATEAPIASKTIDRVLVNADFDKANRLILEFDNGEKIITKKIEIKELIEQHISISAKHSNAHGVFISTETQYLPAINTAVPITLNLTTESYNVELMTPVSSKIVCNESGSYFFNFSLQVTKRNANLANYYIWYRINGQDVPNSSSIVSIAGSSAHGVPSWSFHHEMVAGDYFELVWASPQLNMELEALPANSFSPSIPSVILIVQRTD